MISRMLSTIETNLESKTEIMESESSKSETIVKALTRMTIAIAEDVILQFKQLINSDIINTSCENSL